MSVSNVSRPVVYPRAVLATNIRAGVVLSERPFEDRQRSVSEANSLPRLRFGLVFCRE